MRQKESVRQMNELVEKIKAYAIKHYTEDGWDFVHECWGDSEIRDLLEDSPACTSFEEAVARVSEIAGILNDRRLGAQRASGELEYYGLTE